MLVLSWHLECTLRRAPQIPPPFPRDWDMLAGSFLRIASSGKDHFIPDITSSKGPLRGAERSCALACRWSNSKDKWSSSRAPFRITVS